MSSYLSFFWEQIRTLFPRTCIFTLRLGIYVTDFFCVCVVNSTVFSLPLLPALHNLSLEVTSNTDVRSLMSATYVLLQT
jgi:hypothetical protein